MNSKIVLVSCVGEISDTHTIRYISTLMAHGFEVESIRTGENKDSRFTHHRLPDITANFWPTGVSMLAFFGALYQRARNFVIAGRMLNRIKPRVIFTTEPDAWLLACICKSFFGCKVVVDIREVYEDRIMGFPRIFQKFSLWALKAVMKHLAARTDVIIHVSKERQDIYAYLGNPGRIVVYYPDLEKRPWNEVVDRGADFEVIHAGALRDKYGASEILKAFQRIQNSRLPIKLVVLGGTAGQIKESALLAELKEVGVVELIPQVPYKTVLQYLSKASIGLNIVIPVDQSHYLAQPRKLYEYLSMALPLVVADVPTIRKVVTTWNCGKLVNPYSDEEISAAIINAYNDKDWLVQASQNALKAHQQEYNWELEQKKLVEIFSSLVS